jgi:phenylalanyl-tRNA synthetase beta chain
MKLSYNWLCELLPIKLEVNELSAILTSVGLEVEGIEEHSSIKGGLKNLVVGKILSAEQHPDADRLRVTTVDVGQDEPLQIVCGAPNARAGINVIVALPGVTIYPTSAEPFTIGKSKIRGVVSNGMLCGEDEVSLGTSHDGIVELPETLVVGSAVAAHYNISSDTVLEVGLTPNRMDAMSHLGVAKDVCAYLSNRDNKPYTQIVPDASITNSNEAGTLVNIIDNEKCLRYCGVNISHVKIASSPAWLQNKLMAIGIRPINNVVDVTNYVLQECGQPLHAFDANKISGNTVNVKCLETNTPFTTLDEKERKLLATDLMICDAEKGMCLAGVFGGIHSGVTEQTSNIFLESAYFTNTAIRATSMHHGLRTEAAIRFEKGVDVSQTLYALQRAAKLISEIAGGTISSSVVDVYPTPLKANTITVNYAYINKLSGANYSKQKIKNILLQLCFAITNETENELTVTVPYAKPDITIPADIVEEIMRIDGLDNIPFTGKIQYAIGGATQNAFGRKCKEQIANTLIGKGYYELFTNSITHSAHYTEQDRLVKMINNLSAELDVLRPSMLETGLNVISYNVNRKQNRLHLFEFGKVYFKANEKYIEEEQLSIYISGNTLPEHWNIKEENANIYTAKGIAAAICEALGVQATIVDKDGDLLIVKKKKTLGRITEVPTQTLSKFDIKQNVLHLVFYWPALVAEAEQNKIQFAGIPKYPSVRRDLALVIDKKISYAEVLASVQKANVAMLKEVNIFDVFESEKLGADKKSYAISLQLSHADKTLTVEEVEAEVKKIVSSLEKGVQAQIRL